MKKTLAFLVVALVAMHTQGAQIAWTISNIAFDGSKLANAGTEFTAAMFYLGSGGTLKSSYTAAEIEALSVVASETGTTGKAANTGTFTLTVGTQKNDDVFGFYLKYVSGGKTYYNIVDSDALYTLSGFTDETSTPADYKLVASSMNYGTASGSPTKVTPGGGWTAVPEPSTAALALAGLALLLKRRKA